MLRLVNSLLAIIILTAVCRPLPAQQYSITDLGILPTFDSSIPVAINSQGHVTGYSYVSGYPGATEPWVYIGGSLVDMGNLGGTAMPVAISDNDLVVGTSYLGTYDNGNPIFHVFLYTNGTLTDLGTLGGDNSTAYAVNSSGQVIGESENQSGYWNTFLWQNGTLTSIGAGYEFVGVSLNANGVIAGTSNENDRAYLYLEGNLQDITPPDTDTSYGIGLNDAGSVIEYATQPPATAGGYLYSNGSWMSLGSLGGDNASTHPYAINQAGQIVGASGLANGDTHAFLFNNGALQDINTINSPYSYASAVNATSHVIGEYQTSVGLQHPFVWDSVNGMRDLNYVSNLGNYWLHLDVVVAINDAGQIAGFGTTNYGYMHAFLLTPNVFPALLTLNPNIVKGGKKAFGTVILSGAAPPGGLTVTLSSSSPFAKVPVSVTIPAGAQSATFKVKTKKVKQTTAATITATANGGSQSATLTITH